MAIVRPALLTLPPELRAEIFSHCFPLTPSLTHPWGSSVSTFYGHVPYSLLTSRQIYVECRYLPFTTNTFEFVRHFGSSIASMRTFAERLMPWQRASLRSGKVRILEQDLCFVGLDMWSEACQLMGPGLLEIIIELGGEFKKCAAELLRVNAIWVGHCVGNLKKLRHLRVVVQDELVDEEVKENFHRELENWLLERC